MEGCKTAEALNKDVIDNIQITSQEHMIIKSMESFYTNPQNIMLFMSIINSRSNISIRLIDYFVTKYSKLYKITHKNNEEIVNVFTSYKQQLKAFQKKHFDPFSRGERIPYFMGEMCVITTIGQLNFFRWFIGKNLLDYIVINKLLIENDMNSLNSTSKRKSHDNIASDNGKTRKKREELSISACKCIKKENVNIKISFTFQFKGVFEIGQDEGFFLPTAECVIGEYGYIWLCAYGHLERINIPINDYIIIDNGVFLACNNKYEYTISKLGKSLFSSLFGGEGFGMKFRGVDDDTHIYIQTKNINDFLVNETTTTTDNSTGELLENAINLFTNND